MNVFAEFNHLNAINGHFSRTTHHIKQADPHMPGKSLVNDFQRWHAATNDSILRREVVFKGIAIGFEAPRLLLPQHHRPHVTGHQFRLVIINRSIQFSLIASRTQ